MKKLKVFALLLVTVLLLTGCGTQQNSSKVEEKEKSKGNCKVVDCIKKLDIKDDLEKVNKVIGFEGKLTLEGDTYKVYEWALNDNDTVKVSFYSSSTTISISFKDELIKNSKTDFSKYDEIKTAMKAGQTVTYDDVKKKFGTEGTLIEKSSFSNKYRWVNDKGGYLDATFGLTSGKCTMIIGRI